MQELSHSRTKSFFVNFVSTFFFQITATIVGFIIPMFVLKIYGAEVFGFSTSVMAVVGGINLLEIGLGAGLIQALYKPIHEKKINQVNGILAHAQSYYLKSGAIVFISSIVIALVYSLTNKQGVDFITLLSLSVTLLLGSVFEYLIIGKYRVLLTADEKVGVLVNIQTIALFISSTVRISMMFLGFGVVLMQIVATAVYILRAVIIAAYVKRKYPHSTFSGAKSDVRIENSSVVLHNISNLVVLNTPFLLLLIFTDLSTTSVYAVYAIVFNAVSSILYSMFSQAAVASFGKVAASGDKDSLRASFNLFEFIFSIVLFVVYITTSSLIIDFANLYYPGIKALPFALPLISVLITVAGILFSFRYPLVTLVQADGHFKETKKSVVIEMFLMVSISMMGVVAFGIYGVFIGMIVSAGYRAIHLIWYVNIKILQQSALNSIRRLLVNSIAAVIVLIYLNNNNIFDIKGWFELIFCGIIQAIIILVIFIIANFSIEPKMFKALAALFRQIIRK